MKAKKSLSQNFLNNEKILNFIVNSGDINNDDIILEIGPGTGNLTEKIIQKKPAKFIVVEKDKKLSEELSDKFDKNILVINDLLLFIFLSVTYYCLSHYLH